MKTGIELITEERQRQITEEGWTAEHDHQHNDSELAGAGAYYAIPENRRKYYPNLWMFREEWFKPTPKDRVRELTKAGALIAAEIDRIQNKLS